MIHGAVLLIRGRVRRAGDLIAGRDPQAMDLTRNGPGSHVDCPVRIPVSSFHSDAAMNPPMNAPIMQPGMAPTKKNQIPIRMPTTQPMTIPAKMAPPPAT